MRALGRAWQRFWFAPEPTSSLALLRIAFGVLAFAWAVSLMPDLQAFYSAHGVEPTQPTGPADGSWGLLGISDSGSMLVAVYGALLLGSLCVAVGYRTRIATVVVFVAILSFQHRNPSVLNSGDGLIRHLAFFLMLAPAGASLSVDRWRTARERFWEFPARAPWALRLIQVQVSVVYLASVWEKVQGPGWTSGMAVSAALRLEDFQRFPAPEFLTDSIVLSSVMSYWTLAIELMIGILIWNRAARPLLLTLGAGLHLSIDLSLRIGFFSAAMLTAYIAFLSPAAASALALACRDRLLASRLGRSRRARREALAARAVSPPAS